MADQHSVILGRLTRPHSIRGEIRVDYYADSPLLLEKPLLLRAGEGPARPVTVASWRTWRDQLIIRLEGVSDRSAAEMLRGQELLIDTAHLPETDPDEPYLHDLLGLSVVLSATGESVGMLDDVLFPAGQELWSITSPDGHEILFPAVPEFVDRIDIQAGRILITPPEGLLDLYVPAGGAGKVPHAAVSAPDARPPAART